jgi:Ca2+-binding RTX toxin-like protein
MNIRDLFLRFRRLLPAPRPAPRPPRPGRRPPALEALEDRALPSAYLAAGVLWVLDTPGDDLIRVERAGNAFKITEGPVGQAGTAQFFSAAQVSRITVGATWSWPFNFAPAGTHGNDTVVLDSTLATVPVDLNAGDGSFRVQLTPGSQNLSNLLGSVVTVHDKSSSPGAPHIQIVAEDSAAGPNGAAYTIHSTSLQRSLGPTIQYPDYALVTLDPAQGGNTINIEGELGYVPGFSGAVLTVNAGAGDTVNFDLDDDHAFWGLAAVNGSGGLINFKGLFGAAMTITPSAVMLNQRPMVCYSQMGVALNPDAQFIPVSFTVDGSFAWPVAIHESRLGNTLRVQNNGANVWHVTGLDAGDVNGVVTFDGISNLRGDACPNRFVFSDGASLGGFFEGASVGVDAGGSATLDYSAYTTPVVVNLLNRSATAIGRDIWGNPPTGAVVGPVAEVIGGSGNDTLTGDATPNQVLRGGSGNDALRGGSNNAVLVGGAGDDTLVAGGAGDDTLVAGGGRNVLIGGVGADRLYGGAGDDILISGYTAFDGNDAALLAILAEWADPTKTYSERAIDLGAGVGPGGAFALNSFTVFHDAQEDVLWQSGGADWYFTDPAQWAFINGRIVLLSTGDFVWGP